MKTTPDNPSPELPLEDYQQNFRVAHIYMEKIAHSYFPDMFAEIKETPEEGTSIHFLAVPPPRTFELGTFRKKISLELPCKEFIQKVEQVFMEITGQLNG
mgnify:CR=1 FL=1